MDDPKADDTEDPGLRIGFGLRLKAARENKNLTQQAVGDRFGVGKGTVSAWETGRGAPDAYTLRALARLYDVSADALLWENSLTPAAMKIAAEFDSLTEAQQRTWRALWLAYITEAAAGGEALPPAPPTAPTQVFPGESKAERDRQIAEREFERTSAPQQQKGRRLG